MNGLRRHIVTYAEADPLQGRGELRARPALINAEPHDAQDSGDRERSDRRGEPIHDRDNRRWRVPIRNSGNGRLRW